jgi:hypothetical protein
MYTNKGFTGNDSSSDIDWDPLEVTHFQLIENTVVGDAIGQTADPDGHKHDKLYHTKDQAGVTCASNSITITPIDETSYVHPITVLTNSSTGTFVNAGDAPLTIQGEGVVLSAENGACDIELSPRGGLANRAPVFISTNTSNESLIENRSNEPMKISGGSISLLGNNTGSGSSITLSPQDSNLALHPTVITADSGANTYITCLPADTVTLSAGNVVISSTLASGDGSIVLRPISDSTPGSLNIGTDSGANININNTVNGINISSSGNTTITAPNVILINLPVSSAGLSSGALWNASGFVKIVA